jgi:hypothetical protein
MEIVPRIDVALCVGFGTNFAIHARLSCAQLTLQPRCWATVDGVGNGSYLELGNAHTTVAYENGPFFASIGAGIGFS